MGRVIRDTPEAVVWATSAVLTYLFAGIASGLVFATPNNTSNALMGGVAAVVALILWFGMHFSERTSRSFVGRRLWKTVVWLSAEGPLERAQMLNKLEDTEESDRAQADVFPLEIVPILSGSVVVYITFGIWFPDAPQYVSLSVATMSTLVGFLFYWLSLDWFDADRGERS